MPASADECSDSFEPASGGYEFFIRPRDDIEVPDNARIGDIHITRLPIFDEEDPRENNAVYRFANRLHVLTKHHIVDRVLLFEQGEPYDARVIEETARLLRRERHLFDADVRVVAACNDEVDIEVITKDVWSFTPDVSIKRSGGENTHRFSIRETNLFGLAQELGIVSKKDLDRDSNVFFYRNRNIQGSRVGGIIEYTDSDDGEGYQLGLVKPFFELDARRAWGVNLERLDRVDSQFLRGEEISEVQRDSQDYHVFAGFSRGLVDGVARRWLFGYRYQDLAYSPGNALPPPAPFPVDRTVSYPYVEYIAVEDKYASSYNLNQIRRTEDLHLGYTWWFRLGVAAEAFGSNEDRLVFAGGFEDTLRFNDDELWLHNLSLRGLWHRGRSETEDLVMEYNTRYFRQQTEHRSFFANLNLVYTQNLTGGDQVVFGGETGARGFKNRFQAGDRRWYLRLEERFYSDFHWLNLVRPGWAIFVDAGRAWTPGIDDGQARLDTRH